MAAIRASSSSLVGRMGTDNLSCALQKKERETEKVRARGRRGRSSLPSEPGNGLLAGCMALHGLNMASACVTRMENESSNPRDCCLFFTCTASLSPLSLSFFFVTSSFHHPSPPLHLATTSLSLSFPTSLPRPHHPYHHRLLLLPLSHTLTSSSPFTSS